MATSAGAQFEKKIDLPPSWVRGFLQVQSASSLPGGSVRFQPDWSPKFYCELRQRREGQRPALAALSLAPGQKPSIVIEPWDIGSRSGARLDGREAQEIRIWGRRRLFVLEDDVAARAERATSSCSAAECRRIGASSKRAIASIWACRAGRKTIGRARRASTCWRRRPRCRRATWRRRQSTSNVR